MVDKDLSLQWIFEENIGFDIAFSKKFYFGEIQMVFLLDNNFIKKVNIYSDIVNTDLLIRLEEALNGILFKNKEIINAINSIYLNEYEKEIILNIQQWFWQKEKKR
ncbi:lipoate protein ligase C-terminal domain-containing protein [Clostridium rectalis]|uniref:lipoate protein ligase C-terminal domain-containing protein n=1 Tax=Clostridium rectalis TaxID=2040295 RepID=UPI0013DE5D63|nr:lipoate protein ligase C-terminal domain-containing protein [Clostridium rectalis]